MNTKKNKYERLLEQIETQKQWITTHGGDLQGYIHYYGDPGVPPKYKNGQPHVIHAKTADTTQNLTPVPHQPNTYYAPHYGDGGTKIWEADTNKLKHLEAELQYYEYKQDMNIQNETRQELVLHGIRWANNILVELLANHAAAVSKEGRTALAEAIRNITEAETHFRKI